MISEKEIIMVCAVDERSFILDAQCWRCDVVYSIILNKEDLLDWTAGAGSIENILYYLTAGERELLLSNTCDTCFDALFRSESDLDSEV
jgi:hypothetical protein